MTESIHKQIEQLNRCIDGGANMHLDTLLVPLVVSMKKLLARNELLCGVIQDALHCLDAQRTPARKPLEDALAVDQTSQRAIDNTGADAYACPTCGNIYPDCDLKRQQGDDDE